MEETGPRDQLQVTKRIFNREAEQTCRGVDDWSSVRGRLSSDRTNPQARRACLSCRSACLSPAAGVDVDDRNMTQGAAGARISVHQVIQVADSLRRQGRQRDGDLAVVQRRRGKQATAGMAPSAASICNL